MSYEGTKHFTHVASLIEGSEAVFDYLMSGRLAILAGAGLSMAPPNNLPSAARIATLAKERYDSMSARLIR